MGIGDWFKGLGHTVLGGLSHIPGLGDVLGPLDNCFKTDAERKKANSGQWVHQLALPVAAFFGVTSGVFGLQHITSLGPVGALLSGPIIGGIAYILVDGAGCAVEGKNIPLCIIGDASAWSDSIVKSVVGVDPHFATKFVGSIESGVLSAVFGHACDA